MKKYLFYISQNYSFAILRPIQQILRARGDDVRWFFEGNDVNPGYLSQDEVLLDSVDQVKTYAADVTIATANSIPTFIPGLKVCVFHGFDAGKVKPNGEKSHFKIRGCFDLYCTQGPNTTGPFKANQQKYQFFNVIETGWSTLDALFKSTDQDKISNRPTILLCSTFSKRLSCAKALHASVKSLSQSGKWNWLVQFHPKMSPEVVEMYQAIQSEHLKYIQTDDVIPLLKQADVMVCDTSSVISMFLIQHKPVVTYNNIDPGPYLIDIADPELLEASIEKALSRPEALMREIQIFSDQTHPYQDGKSSERVVKAIDEVLAGKFPVARAKPWNLIKNLKYRKRLHYWKW